ncbi:MAG: signal peptidase II [Gammaproteobacteria bacterium]|nr:signal peptidase II [Gammaproteobacteria bacterium]
MNTSHLRWLWLSLGIIVLDQVSKYWAEYILRGDVIEIFSWFDLSLVHNTGAAFGFLAGYGGWQHVFFVSLAVLVSVVLAVAISRLQDHERHLAVAYALIIAGAIGNAIDRIVHQYVVDFIHWFYQDWHYPHFNVADSAIFIGAALLIFEAFGRPFLNTGQEHENSSG